ncbi:tRNA (adenosine(37)-N6)-threonylcarbamoyltransferase complex dimerization subunit type 1 TsaB [Listeria swaminathanii]|uniref:tRNA (Adenosine(37)-N6)-threonylcarbamoyltransferase complex dimerization subunit type 1 TsaB n=1 Tax=Listeria swaminathanii TaxID=2713501 RepID=A0ABU2IFG6_9LIST|nr:tRNA (adenosine(37)-N6)-threonylcarbamoyltransferase complex dimerization subunit type 1 TsaB [Listeria swaminathanii]MDT0017539.1 tRNA (adenosine(37)-N6)-threonylcarbamoyltransferase complex dimerization subunit type 1 TsaB [Listeria swaminathanii]MDT0022628.1 tRNA (adenosine(37)-N6)-threonylcarbamoyltransferase complex dimerization subunit type 1 TsaB [Listeria swaminathanii]MDT0033592.1 tRNA (adenosine(37)-N6)-threonylcarbamoyltransferase complex dimerization subunit type 1 TsaB [Listeria 
MILGMDTSSDTMTIALFNDGLVIGEYTTNLKKNHSVRLLPAIAALMEECGVKPADLEKIAVAKGPGSYTGLRIGVTVAKTMAWDAGIPIVGISSLALLAENGLYFPGKVVALMDARRGNVYAGVYQAIQGKMVNVAADGHIALVELVEQLAQGEDTILFVGTLTEQIQLAVTEILGERAIFAQADYTYSRASSLVKLAENLDGEPADNFVPDYLKLAEAESKWLESRGSE